MVPSVTFCLIYSEHGDPFLQPLLCFSDASLEPVAITSSEIVYYGCDSSWVNAVPSMQDLFMGYLHISISVSHLEILHKPPPPTEPVHIQSICVCPWMHMHLF